LYIIQWFLEWFARFLKICLPSLIFVLLLILFVLIFFLLFVSSASADGKDINDIIKKATTKATNFENKWLALTGAPKYNIMERMSEFIASNVNATLVQQNLTQKDQSGDTALHVATRHGQVECVELLLQVNSSVSIRNLGFETPYDVLCSAVPLDTVARRRYATKVRSECRALYFKYIPAQKTLFLSHDDCLDHQPRSDDEWESPQRIDAIFDALNSKEFDKWFLPDTELEMREDFDKADVQTLSRVS
jgi:hypothetical protein